MVFSSGMFFWDGVLYWSFQLVLSKAKNKKATRWWLKNCLGFCGAGTPAGGSALITFNIVERSRPRLRTLLAYKAAVSAKSLNCLNGI
jgi:hypothetical protein